MIQEAYCSYEVSKLLKEKGFGEECSYRYIAEPDYKTLEFVCSPIGNGSKYLYNAPSHQMAMAWLREVHNKHCDIGYDIDLNWFFQIIDLKETVEYDYPETKYYHAENETGFNTYEDAVEAALKYVLKNLV